MIIKQLTKEMDAIQCVLKKYQAIQTAIIFGSLANGKARPDSDLDLAVGAEQPMGSTLKIQLISDLAQVLGRPVDLVDLSTIGEPLLGQIVTKGKRIQGNNADFARLLNKHVLEQADFMPYRQLILQKRRRAWIGL